MSVRTIQQAAGVRPFSNGLQKNLSHGEPFLLSRMMFANIYYRKPRTATCGV